MSKEVDLISYLPPKIQEYYEIKKITDSENPEFELLWNASAQARDNIFILTSTEYGLERYEKVVGTYVHTEDSAELRRMRILSLWNDKLPYTHRTLEQQLTMFLGEGNYTLVINEDEYAVLIDVLPVLKQRMREVNDMARRMIPANMSLDYTSKRRLENNVHCKGGVVKSKYIKIGSQLVIDINLNNNIHHQTGSIRQIYKKVGSQLTIDISLNNNIHCSVGSIKQTYKKIG